MLLHKPRQSYEYQTHTAICLFFIHFSVPAGDQTLLLCTQPLGRLCLFVITKKENKDLCGSVRSPSANTCISLGAVDTVLKNCPSRLMPETTDWTPRPKTQHWSPLTPFVKCQSCISPWLVCLLLGRPNRRRHGDASQYSRPPQFSFRSYLLQIPAFCGRSSLCWGLQDLPSALSLLDQRLAEGLQLLPGASQHVYWNPAGVSLGCLSFWNNDLFLSLGQVLVPQIRCRRSREPLAELVFWKVGYGGIQL